MKKTTLHLFFLSAVILLTACASGSAIVTGTKRAPIPVENVKLYLEEPGKYETIGIVKASSENGFTAQGSQDYAIEELRKQAAKLGANGVLIMSTGERAGSSYGTFNNGFFYGGTETAQTVSGKAIFIIE